MRNFFFFIITFSLLTVPRDSANANNICMKADDYADCMRSESARKICLKASDYKGCMNFEKGQTKSESTETKTETETETETETDRVKNIAIDFNKGKDCINGKNICIGTGEEKDMFGMATLYDYFYIQSPEDNEVSYISTFAKDVKVRGKYGRYIDIIYVKRYYQNPKAGTSGYSSGLGNINCTSGFGNSMNCTSTSFNMPGTPSTPGGVVQKKSNLLIDCEDQTYAQYLHGRKRLGKWNKINNKSIIIGSLAKLHCEYVGTGKLEKSNFTKLE